MRWLWRWLASRFRRSTAAGLARQRLADSMEARRRREANEGTPRQRARAQADMHALALEVDLRNGDGPLWSIEYPAPKEIP